MSLLLRALAASALMASAAAPAFAQSTQIVVTGHRRAVDAAAAEAAERPGGVTIVAVEEFADRYAVSLADTLAFTPGVIAQPRFGEEVRLSIRGSGLSNNAHLRGVELLFDGLPITGADGFGDFQELDPLFASHIMVWRGANALSSGAATLGGAIDYTPRDATHPEAPLALRVEGGSFGTSRVHGAAAWSGERADAYAAGTSQRQDGFRAQSEQDNGRLYLNTGLRLSERAETRFSLFIADINQEISGALSLSQALADPSAANPNNLARDYARNINSIRALSRTRLRFGADEQLTFALGYTDRHLHHPISIVLDQYVQEGLALARWDGSAGPLRYTLGARWRDGRTRQRTYVSLAGDRGALAGANVQRAESLDLFGEARLAARDDLDLILGFAVIDTHRDYENDLAPATDDTAQFQKVVPKVGLLWRPNEEVQVFANWSRSYEPPTFSQLTQGGLADFYPIAAQQGATLELGTRGAAGPLAWEIALYEARIEDEFVTFTATAGDPATTRNAPRTIHRGIEAALEALLVRDLGGAALRARATWTHNDFRFDGDPTYRRNRLAGAPSDAARFELALESARWRLAPNVEWRSDDMPVDYANTRFAPGYTLWNLAASFDLGERATVFLDARNLTDEAFVSTASTIADAGAPGANTLLYTPGDGRALFAGVRLRFGAH